MTESMSGQRMLEEGADCSAALQMDQRSAVCWMDECVHFVFALSISAKTARLYTWRQPECTAGSRK